MRYILDIDPIRFDSNSIVIIEPFSLELINDTKNKISKIESTIYETKDFFKSEKLFFVKQYSFIIEST